MNDKTPPTADATDEVLPLPFPPPPSGNRREMGFIRQVARWGLELLTVFVGVYSAFLLNNHQIHRQERQRREQIFAWMETEFTESLASVHEQRAGLLKQSEEFNQQVERGEMPALSAFDFRSDYNPVDLAGILGNGGFDLLEIETIRDLRDYEATLRLMIELTRHDQQLSDTYILPNLDKDPSIFYEPATHKLRPSLRWYTKFFKTTLEGYSMLQTQLEKLLKQIKLEHQRNL